ncbi:MAG: preprotein translocase subunit SecG [Spirochaetaceae bacterium]|jgi:preprotein translocase subunit SecG|nr:preprotein translocase subunit SecG [Spirochaetaceae bacterium]
MGFLNGFLLVLFIIVALLLILLVLAQNEEGDTMGGVFAGGSNTAFGSRSGNILTKTSSVLGALFFALAFSIAIINRGVDSGGVEAAGREASGGRDWFLEETPETGVQPEGTPLEGAAEGTQLEAPPVPVTPEAASE